MAKGFYHYTIMVMRMLPSPMRRDLFGMGRSCFPISLWDDLTDSPGSHPPASLTLAVSFRVIKALD